MSFLRLLAIALPLAAACASDSGKPSPDGGGGSGGPPDASSSACVDLAGTWFVSGTCGADICNITQHACATNVSCSNGAASYTGTIDGSSFTYSGETANGTPATCTGTYASGSISGTCTIMSSVSVTCGFSGTR